MYVHQYTPRTIYALTKPTPPAPRRRSSSRERLAEKEAVGNRPTPPPPLESLHRPYIARRTVSVGSSPSSSLSSSSGWSEEEMELLDDDEKLDTTTRMLRPQPPSTATTRTILPNKNTTQRNKLHAFQHHFLAMLKKEGHGKYSTIAVEEYHTRIIPRYIAGLVYQNLVQTAGAVSSCQAHTWQCSNPSSTTGSSASKLPWKQTTQWSCRSCGVHKSFYQYELHKLQHLAWILHHDFPTSTSTTIAGCTGPETLGYALPQVVRTVHVRRPPDNTPEDDDDAIRRR